MDLTRSTIPGRPHHRRAENRVPRGAATSFIKGRVEYTMLFMPLKQPRIRSSPLRTNGGRLNIKQPNAAPEPRPEAAAPRRLEGVGSRPSLGRDMARTLHCPCTALEPLPCPTLPVPSVCPCLLPH